MIWRLLATWLPETLRGLLPGYRMLQRFLAAFINEPPNSRLKVLAMWLRNKTLIRALRRAGGIEAAVLLVYGDEQSTVPDWIEAAPKFATQECPEPTPRDLAANILSLGSFTGVLPRDLHQ